MLAPGPHTWQGALWWTMPVWLCIMADWFSPAVAYRPPRQLPGGLYLTLLHLLAILQFVSIGLMLKLAGELTWNTWAECATGAANIAAMRILTGTTSCCSGIALAHELIHRPSRHLRLMGRMVLWTVLYDHFAIAHTLGHHRHAATEEDFSTARVDESFDAFWRRSSRGQFSRAWRLENTRLQARPLWQRLPRHRVIQGLAAQSIFMVTVLLIFGWVALAMFVYQAAAATRLLEAVNYFQHWGLKRQQGNTAQALAWSTRSWFSLHSLLGLPLHADHHRHAHKPFHKLRIMGRGPRLPHGYFVMAILIRLSNSRFQRLAKQELHSRQLLY